MGGLDGRSSATAVPLRYLTSFLISPLLFFGFSFGSCRCTKPAVALLSDIISGRCACDMPANRAQAAARASLLSFLAQASSLRCVSLGTRRPLPPTHLLLFFLTLSLSLFLSVRERAGKAL